MDEEKTRQKAVDYLARREHSGYELTQKLKVRGADAATIEAVLSDLAEKGWQSDQRFTEQYILSRKRRGLGLLRITSELRQRGIDKSLIEQCMNQANIDWALQITAVRLKKFSKDIPSDWDEKAKQMRFLQQRGFTQEHIRTELQADNS